MKSFDTALAALFRYNLLQHTIAEEIKAMVLKTLAKSIGSLPGSNHRLRVMAITGNKQPGTGFANSNSQRRSDLVTCRGGLISPNPKLNYDQGTISAAGHGLPSRSGSHLPFPTLLKT
jgi:hypothetical protein